MGLLAHYRLEDLTASLGSDLIYRSNSGKLFPAEGKLGGGYRRAGTNDGADYLEAKTLLHLPGSFTMACWAYVTGAGSSANGLVTNHNHGTNSGSGITVKAVSSEDYRISCNTGTGTGRTYHTYFGTSNIKNRWAHLLVRYHAPTKELSLWVDGEREFVTTYPMYCPPDKLCLFSWSTGYNASAAYRGAAILDDVRIYNHALSRREIQDVSLGLKHQYPLRSHPNDRVSDGVATLINGSYVSTERGLAADVRTGKVDIPLSEISLKLKGETIAFWQKSGRDRPSVPGGSFSSWIVQWGDYYSDNSGGLGLYSGSVVTFLRGPSATGWTNYTGLPGINALYDQHEWIHWAVVFTDDDRFEVYANGVRYANFALSKPYTGLNSMGLVFGLYMQAYLSDIRIYATALTPETIERLARNHTALDEYGSLHGPISEILGEQTPLGNVNRVAEVSIAQGLMRWYPLTGDANDRADPNAGTVVDTTLTSDGALFDLTTSTVEIPHLPIRGGDFTISLWVKATDNGLFAALVDQGTVNNAVTGFTLAIDWRSNRQQSLQWRDPTSGSPDVFTGFFTGRSGVWTHVVVTHQNTTLTAYRDGVFYGTASMNGPGSSLLNAHLGLRPDTGFGLAGLIRDFRVYDVALAPMDVRRLHRLTSLTRPCATLISDALHVTGQIKETAT